MNNIIKLLFCTASIALCLPAMAHVRWSPDGLITPRNLSGATCGQAGDNPVQLKAGSQVHLSYDVIQSHGQDIQIDFSPANDQNFGDYLLATRTEKAGTTELTVNLPDLECNHCTLRVHSAGYASCADVRLVSEAPAEVDVTPPQGVTLPIAEMGSTGVSLSWTNPSEDFDQALVIASDQGFLTELDPMQSYEQGDSWSHFWVAYKGSNNAFVLSDLSPGQNYWFSFFVLDSSGNSSTMMELQIQFSPTEVPAPEISLELWQGGKQSTELWLGAGEVNVVVNADNFNAGNAYQLDWSLSDNRLINTSDNPWSFSFDPSSLQPGVYAVHVELMSEMMSMPIEGDIMLELKAMDAMPERKKKSGGSLTLAFLCVLFGFWVFGALQRRH